VTVYLVGAGPGDPGLVTVRGAELLRQADVVVHDRLVAPSLLAQARPDALVIDVGKQPGRSHRQDRINDLLVEHGRAGSTVVRLKGGDPFVFGRGGEEADALRRAGVPVEVVPGVTAAFAAPAAAGVPVTHRGLSTSVTVVTGHVGDPSAPGGVDWSALAAAGGTLVVLMGMENRAAIAASLTKAGRDPATPVAVVHWGTTPRQRTVRTTLGELGAVELDPPAALVIGPVAGLALGSIEQRPLHGATVLLTRPSDRSVALAGALAAAGAAVVELPLVQVAPPADGGVALREALAGVRRYAWTVFTSATAVDRVMAELRDGRDLAGVALAAVGPATAAALASRGLVADLQAAEASGAGLAATMPLPAPGAEGRVLFPRAAAAGADLVDGLLAKGWAVDDVEAYRTLAVPDDALDPVALAEAPGADVVLLASPSAARRYAELAAAGGWEAAVACIGSTTAAAAADAGLVVGGVASRPTTADQVVAVTECWAACGTHGTRGAP
jgi:uroporphyrinogen III methyltransferase/synthase